MRRCLFTILILAATGCQTARKPGSVYLETGRVVDLLAEPTFDVGRGPPESEFYSLRVPHHDADGHGVFDVPIVFSEQMMFSPMWVFSAAVQLAGVGTHIWAPPPAVKGPPAVVAMTHWTLNRVTGVCFGLPNIGCYWACLASVMAFDAVMHDLPVIAVKGVLRLFRSSEPDRGGKGHKTRQ